MATITLRLYITGQTVRSKQAIANLEWICTNITDMDLEYEVIDILEKPAVAEAEKILATPVLVKISPPPVRRILGDLSDTDKVLFGLDLDY